jgi:hypothetical protein
MADRLSVNKTEQVCSLTALANAHFFTLLFPICSIRSKNHVLVAEDESRSVPFGAVGRRLAAGGDACGLGISTSIS